MNQNFLDDCAGINWFESSGWPDDEFESVPDAVEAFDNPKYQTYLIWSTQTKELEKRAINVISNKIIDEIFSITSEHLTDYVKKGLDNYFERRDPRTENMEINADLGLWPEILEVVIRDLCWAHVELEISVPGFFQRLIPIYKKGHWPCGWSGEFPNGKFAVL